MKKLFLIVLTMSLVSYASAQFNQGRMLAGGSLGFSSIKEKVKSSGTSTDVSTTTSFSFAPSFGYFVVDNVAVGGMIGYSSIKDKDTPTGNTQTVSGFAIGPFVRYYVAPGFFGQGTFEIGSGKVESTSGGSTTSTKSSITIWSLGIGYAYFLNDHVAIEPIIKYQSQTSKPDGSNPPKYIDSGIAFGISIQAYLGDRK